MGAVCAAKGNKAVAATKITVSGALHEINVSWMHLLVDIPIKVLYGLTYISKVTAILGIVQPYFFTSFTSRAGMTGGRFNGSFQLLNIQEGFRRVHNYLGVGLLRCRSIRVF